MKVNKLLIALGILGIYLVSRLLFLTRIPMFTDEAIYLRWSQIMATDWKFIYLPLTDGKPPLFMWLMALGMEILPAVDPLLIGRLTSVTAGLLGLTGIYFASYQLFKNKTISYLSVAMYLICPFTLFYDRFAMADSLLAALALWSLGIGVSLVKSQKFSTAIILGIVIGLGMLTKSPALFFIILLPFLIILNPKNIVKYGFLISIVFLISRGIFSILRLLPMGYVINLKNYEFIIPLSTWLQNPLQFFPGNLWALSYWEYSYLTLGGFILIMLSLLKISRVKIVLVLYFLIPFISVCFFNKVIYPRFLLTFTPMLLILMAAGIWEYRKYLVLTGLLLAPMLYIDYKLYINPVQAQIADNDSRQYLNSWSAGWGLTEVRDFLKIQSGQNNQVVVGMEGTFGLLPYGLELYQKDYHNVKIIGYWPPSDELPSEIIESAKKYPTFYIIYQRDPENLNQKLHLIAKYQQGKSNDYLKLYKVL